MKAVPLDDLMLDIYAVLHFDVGVNLPSSTAPATIPSGPMSLGSMMNLEGATINDQDPSRPPKLGISRREILRVAETAVNLLLEHERTTSTSRRQVADDPWVDRIEPSMVLSSNAPNRRSPSLNVGNRVVVSVPSSRHVSTPGADRDVDMADSSFNGGTGGGSNVDGREPSSEPGSLHDSADDESDLSDVPNMDDEDDAAIFPDLARPKPTPSVSAPPNPPNPSPADIPSGGEQEMVLYTRPAIVHGIEKLNPTPIGNLPAFDSLPTKDYTMSTEGYAQRFTLNQTVWTYTFTAETPGQKVRRLARILDIRIGKNKQNQDADQLIVAWYWHRDEIRHHPEPRISRLASKWPPNPNHLEFMLSNHRDVLVPSALMYVAEQVVIDAICPELVLFCDGMEPGIDTLERLLAQPQRRRWLERAQLSEEGVDKPIRDAEMSVS